MNAPDLAMHWVSGDRPARLLSCAYCGYRGKLRHAKSYRHAGETLSLFRCTKCESLIYDLAGVDAPIVSDSDAIDVHTARAARYVIEAGFSTEHLVSCALAAVPDLPAAALRDYLFVDVGGGMGAASYFVRAVLGVETLTIEPSYTGKLAAEIFGLDVQRAYFEHLPAEVMARLATKTCVLHLNSVVEHLVDPAAVLRSIIERAAIERVAIIVPDAAALDFDGPFVAALQMLAPRDHRHLPTAKGVKLLLERVGFAHQAAFDASGFIIGIGAQHPIAEPSERAQKCSVSLLLERMSRHANPMVAEGGASRLLPVAVLGADHDLMAVLRRKLRYEDHVAPLLAALHDGEWDMIPYHLGPSCYWLAYDSYANGRPDEAMELLRLTDAFADGMAVAHANFALLAIEFKWAGLMLQAAIAESQQRPAVAIAALQAVVDSQFDAQNRARKPVREEAEQKLRALQAASLQPAG